ncbi:universal stress protein [Actinokineospora iranica]|uniref:Nucleotide-binding universal stress protein, UspA family n=1 Tax=Actinokineospora iranica TaxID=1271860 RepID=A0A1G6JRV6_9PSEU|nr:universal stress protein [Actinokineospora iranica]SDC21427.1 Nucleotide-binding universal stress protein, UspA family [Actinokineospora iranica]
MSRAHPVRPPALVAVDGSDSALAAVRWAAAAARRRGLPLRLTHAGGGHLSADPGDPGLRSDYLDALSSRGRHALREAQAAAERAEPGVAVTQSLRLGAAVEVLVEESEQAAMVVLGSRGLTGASSAALGSVSAAVAERADCPVVVVRGPARTEGPIVVGVDGSRTSEAAVAWAFEQASLTGAPLVALHTYSDVAFPGLWVTVPLSVDWHAVTGLEQHLLDERMAGWQEKHPDVEVHRVVERDRPVRALLARGTAARLLVVGARGQHAPAGMGLGSTSQALLRCADCPVAVVHPRPR